MPTTRVEGGQDLNINNELLEDVVTDKMGEYSTYVLLSRAIPDIRDGLKPSYRRIIWAMREMKATKFTKSANIAGEVMRYHPHGSTYPTMVGMAQKDGQLNPYLVGKGNFGNHSSELAFASDRYTELKLSEASLNMLEDAKKRGVKMVDNYDSTRKLPEVFPVKYPSVLAYAQSGIGVGFSSSIPSFNTTELCEATIKYIEKGKETLLVPDFGTGGYVVNDKSIVESINKYGTGSIQQRAKAEIDGDEIIITEVPYNTTKEKIISKILDLYKKDKLREVKNVDDLSGLSGMSVVITAKKKTDMKALLEKLYLNTPMQTSYPSNMMVLNLDGLPEQKGVWGIIEDWLNWRREVISRMLKYDSEIKSRNLEILQGLEIIKDEIDKVVDVIRNSTDKNVISNLVKEFGLSDTQAERIAELKLRNLTTTFITKQLKNIKGLEKEIKDIKKAIESDTIKDQMIVSDLKDIIKEFGVERKSELINKSEIIKKREAIPEEPEFEEYNVKVFTTKENYLKKIPLTSLRGDFDIKTKHGDEIVGEVDTTNLEEVLVFTDKRNVYKIQLGDIPNSRPSELGVYIPNIVDLEQGESVLFVSPLKDEHSSILIAYEDGKVSKVETKAYRTKQNRSVLRNAYANKVPIFFKAMSEDIDLLAVSEKGKAIILNTGLISSKATRHSNGNIFMKLKKGDNVKYYDDDIESLVNSEHYILKGSGFGKNIK